MPMIPADKLIAWTSDTRWGELEISINLAKPEKDPRDIAKAASGEVDKPCDLCAELARGGGEPIELCGETWLHKESPYGYCEGHCCVTALEHRPMRVNRVALQRLFAFIDQHPDMFIGMNADLPIVGGSILAHDHFQGGKHTFPMQKAPLDREFELHGFSSMRAGIVRWPITVIRLYGNESGPIIDAACDVHSAWAEFSDAAAGIVARDAGGQHNTITPILCKRNGVYQLDIALRCNITSAEHPMGVFHPHAHLHHIKKENIGLIEVAGLAILPPRVKRVMEEQGLSRDEVGTLFAEVLECAGVFKWDAEGRSALNRFLNTL